MPLILAEELDTLTAQEIQKWDQRAGDGNCIFIDVIDKHNLTDERFTRLQCLVRQRDEPSESRPVDAGELDAKLRHISPRHSPAPSDTTSVRTAGWDITEEQHIDYLIRTADKCYKQLKDIGGRPSREINHNPGPCPAWKSDIDKRYHLPDHWHGEVGRIDREETGRWRDFRWHQAKVRADSETFDRYKEAVYKHQQVKGIDWAVELRLDRQTKLDEWREYYIYEHRKRGAPEKKLTRAERGLESAKERMTKAARNGSVGIPENVLYERLRERSEWKEKVSQAQKEMETAQKRLEVLRADELLSTIERNIFTERAKEEFESAQKRLETEKSAEKSDEWEQLTKELERKAAQHSLERQHGEVTYARTCLERLDTLLDWITGQFTEIAAEYASSSWEGQYNCDLLDGWENYYIYTHECLEDVQEAEKLRYGSEPDTRTEAQKAYADFRFPQQREGPIKAHLAWIEREFPQIAAKHITFGRDSPSAGDLQDQDLAVPPYSKPSPGGPTRKASPPGVARKSARGKGKTARERSPLKQVQPLKVTKPSQKGKRPLSQKLSAARHEVQLPGDRVNDVGQADEQSVPEVAACKASPSGVARKSARGKGKPASERSPLKQVQPLKVTKPSQKGKRPLNQKSGTARHKVRLPGEHVNEAGQADKQGPPKAVQHKSEQVCQQTRDPVADTVVRRSARLLSRAEKIRSLESDADVNPVPLSTMARQKSSQPTSVHKNAASSGKPQGISKTRRRKATSKKRKND